MPLYSPTAAPTLANIGPFPTPQTNLGIYAAASDYTLSYSEGVPNYSQIAATRTGNNGAASTSMVPVFYAQNIEGVNASTQLRRPFYFLQARLAGSTGFSQANYTHLEVLSTDVNAQSVSFGGACHQSGPGAGWAGYGIGLLRNSSGAVYGAEFDVGNYTGADMTYNATPTVGAHTIGIWIYAQAGNKNSMALGWAAGAGGQYQIGIYSFANSVARVLWDNYASPPVGIRFNNGCSTDGTGTTPGGLGIDFGPNAKGYGAGIGQGAVNYHSHKRLIGPDAAEDPTNGGKSYWLFDTVNYRDVCVIAGAPVIQFAGGSMLPGGNNSYDLGASGLEFRTLYVHSMVNGAFGVAGLASAAVAYQRAFVSDSTVAATGNFGAIVVGGGSNKVPVYSDGVNWRIG